MLGRQEGTSYWFDRLWYCSWPSFSKGVQGLDTSSLTFRLIVFAINGLLCGLVHGLTSICSLQAWCSIAFEGSKVLNNHFEVHCCLVTEIAASLFVCISLLPSLLRSHSLALFAASILRATSMSSLKWHRSWRVFKKRFWLFWLDSVQLYIAFFRLLPLYAASANVCGLVYGLVSKGWAIHSEGSIYSPTTFSLLPFIRWLITFSVRLVKSSPSSPLQPRSARYLLSTWIGTSIFCFLVQMF